MSSLYEDNIAIFRLDTYQIVVINVLKLKKNINTVHTVTAIELSPMFICMLIIYVRNVNGVKQQDYCNGMIFS